MTGELYRVDKFRTGKSECRLLVATASIARGQTIFIESPIKYNNVRICAPKSPKHCFNCCASVIKVVSCEACSAVYCSQECASFHCGDECAAFALLDLETVDEDDLSLLILCLKYSISCRELDAKREISELNADFSLDCAHFNTVRGPLVQNVVKVIQKAAALLNADEAHVSSLTHFAKVIYSNAYNVNWTRGDGVGIFKIASMLNHSCNPNADTKFATTGGEATLRLVAIRPIAAGEEINVDYGACLWHPTILRQLDLYINRSFWCFCVRCESESPLSDKHKAKLCDLVERSSEFAEWYLRCSSMPLLALLGLQDFVGYPPGKLFCSNEVQRSFLSIERQSGIIRARLCISSDLDYILGSEKVCIFSILSDFSLPKTLDNLEGDLLNGQFTTSYSLELLRQIYAGFEIVYIFLKYSRKVAYAQVKDHWSLPKLREYLEKLKSILKACLYLKDNEAVLSDLWSVQSWLRGSGNSII